MSTQKIVPHLWFDKEAKEAAQFYTSVFPNSEITFTYRLHNTPSGDFDVIEFDLSGYSFIAIDGGPFFKKNPSISFFVNFDPSKDAHAKENLDHLWQQLSQGGEALMPLQEYPFSKHYGWIQDRYGISWQLILTNPEGEDRPFIVPSLMFTNESYGKAEEASELYLSVFKNSRRGLMARYPAGMGPDKEGTVMYTDFMLENQWFTAMDSAYPHKFGFNEAISLLVQCEDQDEIDYFWGKLSADPEAEQCGWLKDAYGVSWQISPVALEEMMMKGTQQQIDRVTQVFLDMKKVDIRKLEEAFESEG